MMILLWHGQAVSEIAGGLKEKRPRFWRTFFCLVGCLEVGLQLFVLDCFLMEQRLARSRCYTSFLF
jgi:hypothetical protein